MVKNPDFEKKVRRAPNGEFTDKPGAGSSGVNLGSNTVSPIVGQGRPWRKLLDVFEAFTRGGLEPLVQTDFPAGYSSHTSYHFDDVIINRYSSSGGHPMWEISSPNGESEITFTTDHDLLPRGDMYIIFRNEGRMFDCSNKAVHFRSVDDWPIPRAPLWEIVTYGDGVMRVQHFDGQRQRYFTLKDGVCFERNYENLTEIDVDANFDNSHPLHSQWVYKDEFNDYLMDVAQLRQWCAAKDQ